MGIKVALVGNPNSGKTTFFNALTGSDQSCRYWYNTTLEKKSGRCKRRKSIRIVELPDIYSLSPYTLEEVIARDYLLDDSPDVILNIIDGTNLERSLLLTVQLMELGIPVVAAVNRMDILKKNGDQINTKELGRRLGCRVVEVCAYKGKGMADTKDAITEAAQSTRRILPQQHFSPDVEKALTEISQLALKTVDPRRKKWFAVKLFERDKKILKKADITERTKDLIDKEAIKTESKFGMDTESLIIAERYDYIKAVVRSCYKKNEENHLPDISDKIDKIVLNRWASLPIFFAVMLLVCTIAVMPLSMFGGISPGTFLGDWLKNGILGKGFYLFGAEDMYVPGLGNFLESWLTEMGSPDWLHSLIMDGILVGVGTLLAFIPQMVLLFLLTGFLESCGYMARVALIFDRIFRWFGLSGMSAVSLFVGSMDSTAGIMAADTVKNDRDRKMTVIASSFVPSGTKFPLITTAAAALFDGSPLVMVCAYFAGILCAAVSGMMLKKTSLFAGNPVPFVMELPKYHMPRMGHIFRCMWQRVTAFLKKSWLIILISSLALWAGMRFGRTGEEFGFNASLPLNDSVLGILCANIAWLFAPLGFGDRKACTAVIMGLFSKEHIVSLIGTADFQAMAPLAGCSFLMFNLLCLSSFAAVGAVKKELNSIKWTLFAIVWQFLFAYAVSLMIYQFGSALTGALGGEYAIYHIVGLIISIGLLFFIILMFFMPYKESLSLHSSVIDKRR